MMGQNCLFNIINIKPTILSHTYINNIIGGDWNEFQPLPHKKAGAFLMGLCIRF